MSIPVVIIHRGNPLYLNVAIKQAKHYNNDVILIGDDSNKQICLDCGVLHYDIGSFPNQLSTRFSTVYEHMSTNSREFEYLCFDRWFILLELMKREKLESVLHIDSDVMLYDNIPMLFKNMVSEYSSGYCIAQQEYEEFKWDASAHTSFWKTQALEQFCHFILDQYTGKVDELRKKWDWHHRENIAGGVCDMNLLYLYYIQNSSSVVNLTAVNAGGVTFDNNVNNSSNLFPGEYQMGKSLVFFTTKKLEMVNHKPVGENLVLGKKVRFGSLHFQGEAKSLMFHYFQDKMPIRQTISTLGSTGKVMLKKMLGK
ncbi:MAG TPA: hypothetical protein VEZ17_03185 [Chitinophagaceae bacterium]|jgi:hypothetical protein|nr:hypothetical protein [Chitinophagaceae bacterium]